MDRAEFGEFLNGDRTRGIVYLIQGIRHDGYPRTRLQNRRFPDRARPGLGVGDCGLVQQGRTAQPADCSPAGLARSHTARVDEATNQSAVRRSHTAGRRLRAGRYGLPQWRSRGQPLGSDAAVGGGPAASREDEYRRGARGVELLDRVAPKAIAEQKARRVACETVHCSVVTSQLCCARGGLGCPCSCRVTGHVSSEHSVSPAPSSCSLSVPSIITRWRVARLKPPTPMRRLSMMVCCGRKFVSHTRLVHRRDPKDSDILNVNIFASLLTPLSLSAQVVLAHVGVVE